VSRLTCRFLCVNMSADIDLVVGVLKICHWEALKVQTGDPVYINQV
jgi:hypothetical protein